MKNLVKKITKASVVALALLGTYARADVNTLSRFVEGMAAVVPNKLDLGATAEVRYDDNINSEPRRNRVDSLILYGSLFADLHRQVESLGSYGLRGSVGYEYYDHECSDRSDFIWDLAPYVNGSIGGGEHLTWRISLSSVGKRERMSSGDTRYALHYNNTIALGADYQYHPRWGVMSNAGYTWDYYPQKAFQSHSKQIWELSVSPYYRFTEKLRGGFRVAAEATMYRNDDTNDDSRRMKYNAFLDWNPSNILSVYAEAGLEKSYYDGETRGTNYERHFLPDASVSIRYLPFTNLGLTYTSSLSQKDSTLNRSIVWAWSNSLIANWQITQKILLSQTIGASVDDQKDGNADTYEWFYSANASYKFSKHLSFYAGYNYTDTYYKYIHDLDYDESVVKVGATFTM